MKTSFVNDFLMAIHDGANPWFAVALSVFLITLIILGISPIRVTDEKKAIDLAKIHIRYMMVIFICVLCPLFFVMMYMVSTKYFGSSKYWDSLIQEISDSLDILWPLK